MARAEHREVPAIQRQDAPKAKTFCCGYDARIYQPDIAIGVLLHELSRAREIAQGRQLEPELAGQYGSEDRESGSRAKA